MHQSLLLPEPADLEAIQGCYSVFGQDSLDSFFPLRGSQAARWRNGIMSPRGVLSPDPQAIAQAARDFFQATPVEHTYDAKVPYFNLWLAHGMEPPKEWVDQIEALGFHRKSSLTLALYRAPIPVSLPQGYFFSCGTIGERRIRRLFLEVMHEAFPKDDPSFFWSEIFKAIEVSEGATRIVVIQSGRGKPAAAALVTSTTSGAYLWCDGVMKPHRGKGLHESLVALRQLVSAPDGCRHWLFSTVNPRLLRKGHSRFTDHIYYAQQANLATR